MARVPDPFERELLAALPRLERAALAWTRDPEAAADLVQTAIERALVYRESYKLGSNMVAWLCFIARNVFLSDRRRAWRSVTMPYVGEEAGVALADTIPQAPSQHDKLECDELLEAIALLPFDQAEAVLMISEGLSYEEAAAESGAAEGTIKSRVARGRAALRAFFGLNIIDEGKTV